MKELRGSFKKYVDFRQNCFSRRRIHSDSDLFGQQIKINKFDKIFQKIINNKLAAKGVSEYGLMVLFIYDILTVDD